MLLGMSKQLVYAFPGFYNKETIYSNNLRYDYTNMRFEEEPFERLLVERLKEFIRKKKDDGDPNGDIVSLELQEGFISCENESEDAN